jgi:hypothetical protein
MSNSVPHSGRRSVYLLSFMLLIAATPCRGQLANRPLTEAQFREATRAVIASGDWAAQQEFLNKALLASIKAIPAGADAKRYDDVLNDSLMSLVLAQAELIRRTSENTETIVLAPTGNSDPASRGRVRRTTGTTNTIAIAARGCDDPAFMEWLLTDANTMEALLTSLKPEDDPARVFHIWRNLWKSDGNSSHEYRNLALACALVFDNPPHPWFTRKPVVKPVDVEKRYKFYCDADKGNRLRTDLKDIPVCELVWVVDAPVPDEELAWAQAHINAPREKWSETYSMIKYRMDMVTEHKSPYEEYTLAEILKKGGICVDQSYFAAVTAKAKGIPAMSIRGDGQRGGHAWFGYKASEKKWNMTAGQYTEDDFATGTTIDPQTGKQVKEQELYLMADEQRRSPSYLTAWRLLWMSHVAAGSENGAAVEAALLEAAVSTSSRHTQAWTEYTDYLRQTKAGADKWKQVIKTMRNAFHGYRDMLTQVDQLERDMVLTAKGTDAVMKKMNGDTRKLAHGKDARTDLVLENIAKQAEILNKSGNTNAVNELYRKSLSTYGKEVVAFETLASDYFAYAKDSGKTQESLRNIEGTYKRYFGVNSSDYFAMRTQAELLDMISDFHKQAGQDKEAAKLKKEADRLRKLAQVGEGKFK